jgi:hypothetical protein
VCSHVRLHLSTTTAPFCPPFCFLPLVSPPPPPILCYDRFHPSPSHDFATVSEWDRVTGNLPDSLLSDSPWCAELLSRKAQGWSAERPTSGVPVGEVNAGAGAASRVRVEAAAAADAAGSSSSGGGAGAAGAGGASATGGFARRVGGEMPTLLNLRLARVGGAGGGGGGKKGGAGRLAKGESLCEGSEVLPDNLFGASFSTRPAADKPRRTSSVASAAAIAAAEGARLAIAGSVQSSGNARRDELELESTITVKKVPLRLVTRLSSHTSPGMAGGVAATGVAAAAAAAGGVAAAAAGVAGVAGVAGAGGGECAAVLGEGKGGGGGGRIG